MEHDYEAQKVPGMLRCFGCERLHVFLDSLRGSGIQSCVVGVGFGSVWLTDLDAGVVWRIDPALQ